VCILLCDERTTLLLLYCIQCKVLSTVRNSKKLLVTVVAKRPDVQLQIHYTSNFIIPTRS
jgi:hypothetical protein